jgi:hypothetical protein
MSKKITCKHCGTVRVVNKTSGYIGVDFYKKGTINKWRARATDNKGKTHHLGYHRTELEASKVYDYFIINNKIVNRPLNYPMAVNNGK